MPSYRSTLLIASLLTAAACGSDANSDPLLDDNLWLGMARDTALKVLAAGKTGDSTANVSRKEQYFLSGKILEVLFYSRDDLKETEGAPPPPESSLRPVVLLDGRVIGWGWAHFDSVATENKIRVRVRSSGP